MYEITDGSFRLEGIGEYHAYGILTPEGERIDDLTVDKSRLKLFVALLNRYGIKPFHLMDMVIDFLE